MRKETKLYSPVLDLVSAEQLLALGGRRRLQRAPQPDDPLESLGGRCDWLELRADLLGEPDPDRLRVPQRLLPREALR